MKNNFSAKKQKKIDSLKKVFYILQNVKYDLSGLVAGGVCRVVVIEQKDCE